MKIEKHSKKDDLVKIDKYFTCLNIGKFDEEIVRFWQINFEHFINKINSRDVEFIKDSGFILNHKDNTTFKVVFTPTFVAPTKITLELTNLSGYLCQSIVIDFSDNYTNTVKITHNSCYQSDNCIRRKKIDKTYINMKKYYQKKVEYVVQRSLTHDNNYSKEITEIYPYLDNRYIRSTIFVGTNEEQNSKTTFEKYDGKNIKLITPLEFTFELEQEKNKLKVLKKCA